VLVGDLAFQNKCMRHMREFRERGGTLVFVGHAGHQVQAACDRAIVLERGECRFDGDVVDALDYYFRQQQSGDAIPVTAGGSGAALLQMAATNAQGVTMATSVRGPQAPRVPARPPTSSRLHRQRAHPRALLFCAFYSIDGQRALAGAALEIPGGLVAGAASVHARLPRLPFNEGSYQLRLALIDMELGYPVALKGWMDQSVRVTVDGDASVVSTRSHHRLPVMLAVGA
jgi:hypothetical protein